MGLDESLRGDFPEVHPSHVMFWVSVKERMPKEHEYPNAIFRTKDGRMIQATKFLIEGMMSPKTPDHLQFPATHWILLMPPTS